MDEDQDFCRVCRSESTPDHPLYHPCKCSGSIRFVHEDCLIEWLSHSKKKYCELCEHPFTFSPIYRDDMPERVPFSILLTKSFQQSITIFKQLGRALLVIFVWLMLVPNVTLFSWRFFFWSGENIGIRVNATEPIQHGNQTMETIDAHSPALTYLNTFLNNSMEGLVIMAFVIVNLIAAYLFRDWIMQNMPAEPEVIANNNNNNNNNQDQGELEQRALDTIVNLMQALNQEGRDPADLQQIRRRMENLREELNHDWTEENREALRERLLRHESESEHEEEQDDHDFMRRIQEREEILDGEIQRAHVFGRHMMDEPLVDRRGPVEFNYDTDDSEPVEFEREDTVVLEDNEPADFDRIERVVFERNEPVVPEIQRNEPVAAEPILLRQQQQQQVNVDAPIDMGDEAIGILEAVGFRGSPWIMVQNSALLSLVMCICLGATVWIPYVLGRLVILVRPTAFIQTPIYLMRLITDPLVDFVLDLCLPFIWSKVKFLVPQQIQAFFDQPPTVSAPSASEGSSQFDWLQTEFESISRVALERWRGFAMETSGLDRVVCIFVGYLVLFGIGSWILSYRTRRGSNIRSMILRQGVLVKVLFFIVIELVIFPAVCGFLLDMSTLPLFANATFMTRIEFHTSRPYTSYFIHWVLGTGVLFYFANFIAVCRSIIRPGVMWFIRDPNDPQFHPIQEMVERPFGNLLHKISQSALIYASMLVFGVGSVTYTLGWSGCVFPLELTWDLWIVKDLLIVQFLLPPLMAIVDPRANAKKLFGLWWRWASSKLRLTFFMFNERRPEEEGHHVARTWKAFLFAQKAKVPEDDVELEDEHAPVVFKRDGMMVRVPKYDSVPVDPKRRMIVPVDPVTFEAIDEEERGREHPAAAHTRDESQSTIVVYLPPHYKQRFLVFLLYMWFFISISTCSVTVLPLLFGRFIFKYCLGVKVNDLYSLTLGIYLLCGVGLYIYWTRQYKEFTSQQEAQQFKKEKTSMVLKYLYLSSMIGVVVPILFGITVDLFIMMPIRGNAHSETGLLIYVSQNWSYGVAYMSALYHAIQYLPANNRLKVKLNEMIGQEIDLWNITRTIIVPVIASAILAITIPKLISWGILQFTDDMIATRYMYPIVFSIALLVLSSFVIKKLLSIWMETVRDDTYLIGKRLHNMQTEPENDTALH